jgi:hypothetical protein
MPTTTRTTPASPIPVPEIDSDTPVAVIPTASVAPLDGPADGERINTFTLAPEKSGWAFDDALGDLRGRVLGKPLTYAAGAFMLGLLVARVLR